MTTIVWVHVSRRPHPATPAGKCGRDGNTLRLLLLHLLMPSLGLPDTITVKTGGQNREKSV